MFSVYIQPTDQMYIVIILFILICKGTIETLSYYKVF